MRSGAAGYHGRAQHPLPHLRVSRARDRPVGVVLRRGPTDWARLSLWHVGVDRLEHGQWIKGRVFERRSDLSADGSLFAAFIRQSGGKEPDGADTWIAVSRPPFFSALAVWGSWAGTYTHRQPFFPDRRSLWLGFQSETAPARGSVLPPWLRIAPPTEVGYVDRTSGVGRIGPCTSIGCFATAGSSSRTPRTGRLWQRRHPSRPFTLHMRHSFESFRREGGPYQHGPQVSGEAGQTEHAIGKAEWADWDQRGRLVVASRGRLWHWNLDGTESHLIADLTDQHPRSPAGAGWRAGGIARRPSNRGRTGCAEPGLPLNPREGDPDNSRAR